MRQALALALFALPAAALAAEHPIPDVSAGPAIYHARVVRAKTSAADLALAEPRLPASARHELGPLTAAERQSLASPEKPRPLRFKASRQKIGIVRPLPAEIGFSSIPDPPGAGERRSFAGGLLERTVDGGLGWTAAFSSSGAGGLRLHIREARLPAGSRVYVYAPGAGEVHGPYSFDSGTRPEGFWTNTVFGDSILLEVRLPRLEAAAASAARLFVTSVAHLEGGPFAPRPGAAAALLSPLDQSCFVDATCVTTEEFSNVELAKLSAARLSFLDGASFFLCSGALLGDTAQTLTPYLLTSNHCFRTQSSATSLEAIFRYETSTCNGPFPGPSGFPRTLGSTLLATGEETDYTLVQLSQDPPDGSVLLGWTTQDYSHSGGTSIYRLSHPDGNPQHYSRDEISSVPTPSSCFEAAQGDFIYSKDVVGGLGGGSSGAPVYLENLQVVGQLLGTCGTNVEDDCDRVSNSTVDGAFRISFPALQPFLDPVNPGPCVPGATTLCLNGGRFRVTTDWAKPDGTHGPGTAAGLTGDSGYFWFFNPANIEVVAKVLSSCAPPFNTHWVFAAGLTNVDVTVRVEDSQTGSVRIYYNPQGEAFLPVQDTSAFPCP